MQELKNETRTIVIYEAPHHLLHTLEELYQVLGNRKISVCRELTKKHEEILRMSLEEAVDYYKVQEARGEFVLVVEGKSYDDIEEENRQKWTTMDLQEHMNLYESKGISRKEAMKQVAKDRGISKRDVYQQLLNH